MAKCNQCGSHAVKWLASYRTRRPYLVNVKPDGSCVRNDFHSKTCSARDQQAVNANAENARSLEMQSSNVAEMPLSLKSQTISDINIVAPEQAERLIELDRESLVATLNGMFAASDTSIQIDGKISKTVEVHDQLLDVMGKLASLPDTSKQSDPGSHPATSKIDASTTGKSEFAYMDKLRKRYESATTREEQDLLIRLMQEHPEHPRNNRTEKPANKKPATRQARYVCTVKPNHELIAEVIPGKAHICAHCKRIMKFSGIVNA